MNTEKTEYTEHTKYTEYTDRLAKIEAVLAKWLPQSPDTAWVEAVFGRLSHDGENPLAGSVAPDMAKTLTLPGWDLVNRGGKRWRPLLMLLTAESISGDRGADFALPLTPLVEFPHNASLIHDDIEDNATERRGKPAVHLLYGMDTAINSGAFMYFLPLACLSSWSQAANADPKAAVKREQVWALWASHMRALHVGQSMDIAWHRDFHSLPSLDEYLRMCRLKTGCLARFAAVLGVHCASFADSALGETEVTHLSAAFARAAEQLGVGFQILDDEKNLRTGVPGKKRGDDIVEGKKSLPILLYLHRYPHQRDFTARCFAAARTSGVEAPELELLINELEKSGVLDEAREKGLNFIKESQRAFSDPISGSFYLQPKGQELLSGLIDLLQS